MHLPFQQNLVHSGSSGYEIFKFFPIINFWVSIIYPSQVGFITYLIVRRGLNQEGCGAHFVVEIYRRF